MSLKIGKQWVFLNWPNLQSFSILDEIHSFLGFNTDDKKRRLMLQKPLSIIDSSEK